MISFSSTSNSTDTASTAIVWREASLEPVVDTAIGLIEKLKELYRSVEELRGSEAEEVHAAIEATSERLYIALVRLEHHHVNFVLNRLVAGGNGRIDLNQFKRGLPFIDDMLRDFHLQLERGMGQQPKLCSKPASSAHRTEDDAIHPKRWDSALKLIATFARDYGYRDSKTRNHSVNQAKSALERIGLRLDDQTIRGLFDDAWKRHVCEIQLSEEDG